MSVTIELAPQVEARFRQEASARGIPLVEYVAESLNTLAEKLPQAAETAQSADEDIPEYWKGYVGVVESDGHLNARNHSQVFLDILEEKHRAGHL